MPQRQPDRGAQVLRPWDRLETETDRAWATFMIYRDAPPNVRSLAWLQRQTGKSRSYVRHLHAWASKYRWRQRAAAFDRWRDQRAQELVAEQLAEQRLSVLQRQEEARKQHLAVARGLLQIGVEALLHKDPTKRLPVDNVQQARLLIKLGVDVERASLEMGTVASVDGTPGAEVETVVLDLQGSSSEDEDYLAKLEWISKHLARDTQHGSADQGLAGATQP